MPSPVISPPDHQPYNFGLALIGDAQGFRKRDRTRAAIQNAACRLLDRLSLTSLTVAQICRQASIAHGTFYIYYPDRQALVADMLLRFVDFVQKTMRRAPPSADGNMTRAAMQAYYDLFEQNRGMMKCLINHQNDFPASKQAFQRLNREWAEIVAASQVRKMKRQGHGAQLSHDELMRRAYALGGMVDQYLAALFLNQDQSVAALSRDRDAVIDTLSHIWQHGVAA